MAQLWKDPNYTGTTYRLTDSTLISDLSKTPIGNRTVSSVTVNPGYELTLFESTNFQGAPFVITGPSGIVFLKNVGFDDRVSSLMLEQVGLRTSVFPGKPYTPLANFWADPDYKGRELKITNIGQINNLDVLPIKNKSISSLRVSDGFRVRLFDDIDFKGKFIDIFGPISVENLSRAGFNDKTKSILVERN